jgi:acetylglutamate kinase
MSGSTRANRPRVRGRSIVVKIGGAAAEEADAALGFAAERHRAGEEVVLVHGGGPLVGEWSRRIGLEPRFQDGLRVTDAATRDVAIAVLTGLVNKRLVAALVARGVEAVGVSGADGGLLSVRRAVAALGLVGRVETVRPALLEALLEARAVPVVAPAAIGPDGELLNVNADEVAGAIAAAFGARLLVFVTDVEGVRDADGRVIARLDAPAIDRLRAAGVVSGGMLPKLEACLAAAAAGCVAAIVRGGDHEALRALAEGRTAGTVVAA